MQGDTLPSGIVRVLPLIGAMMMMMMMMMMMRKMAWKWWVVGGGGVGYGDIGDCHVTQRHQS